jgi:hypothetical protein
MRRPPGRPPPAVPPRVALSAGPRLSKPTSEGPVSSGPRVNFVPELLTGYEGELGRHACASRLGCRMA